jgi:hypothetical protein
MGPDTAGLAPQNRHGLYLPARPLLRLALRLPLATTGNIK